MVLFRCRQSQGAMNDPDHSPAWAARAAISSVSYVCEYRTTDNAQPDRTLVPGAHGGPGGYVEKLKAGPGGPRGPLSFAIDAKMLKYLAEGGAKGAPTRSKIRGRTGNYRS